MHDSWLKLVDCVFRPARPRPRLELCLQERERLLDARRLVTQERARAIASCVAEIEATRAEVFAAQDGVVTSRMTDLEREWRRLSRTSGSDSNSDLDGGLMDLWARIAPSSWIDRKRWRDSNPAAQLDAAIALACDVEGVETTEAAIDQLRVAHEAWGLTTISIGTRARWRLFERDDAHDSRDFDGTVALLAKPLHAAREAVSSCDGGSMVLEHARELERVVYEAALTRFPERDVLARAIAHAALVDCVWRRACATFGSACRVSHTACAVIAAPLSAYANPVTPLRTLWSAGYVLSAIDDHGVTIEIPPLPLPLTCT